MTDVEAALLKEIEPRKKHLRTFFGGDTDSSNEKKDESNSAAIVDVGFQGIFDFFKDTRGEVHPSVEMTSLRKTYATFKSEAAFDIFTLRFGRLVFLGAVECEDDEHKKEAAEQLKRVFLLSYLHAKSLGLLAEREELAYLAPINSGGYGEVHVMAKSSSSAAGARGKPQLLAMKLAKKEMHGELKHEAKMLKNLPKFDLIISFHGTAKLGEDLALYVGFMSGSLFEVIDSFFSYRYGLVEQDLFESCVPRVVRTYIERCILKAVEFLHGEGIIHRDLSDRNVLVLLAPLAYQVSQLDAEIRHLQLKGIGVPSLEDTVAVDKFVAPLLKFETISAAVKLADFGSSRKFKKDEYATDDFGLMREW